MAEPGGSALGPLEAEAMAVLWQADAPLSVREVVDRLNAGRAAPLAYTTVVAALVVAGHLGLGLLAVVEYARLDWLSSEPYELTAVIVVAGSAALAIVGALRVMWPTARGNRVLWRLLRVANRPLPAPVRAVAESLGIADSIDVVA